jgi:hypothetical protein
VNGIAEVPLTDIAVEAFRCQLAVSGPGPFLFPSEGNADRYQKTFKTVWHATLRRAGVRYFRIYEPPIDVCHPVKRWQSCGRICYSASSAGGRQGFQEVFSDEVADEREALGKLNCNANETGKGSDTAWTN